MTTGTTVRLTEEMTAISRAESVLMCRSMGGQVEYWARIGRAVERSGHFSYDKVKRALSGRLDVDALNEWEKPVFDEAHDLATRKPLENEQRAHAERLRAMSDAGVDTSTLGD